MIDHFHVAVLLDPKLADDNIVYAAGRVSPGVGFIIPAERREEKNGSSHT